VLASLTGSFDQGVSLNSWAFSLQVVALPLSDTSVPNSGLAITLVQGKGVMRSADTAITYSRRSFENPPWPLKAKSSSPSGGIGPVAETASSRNGADADDGKGKSTPDSCWRAIAR